MNDKLKLILALALNLILKCAQTLRKGLAFEHSLLKLSRLILDCSIEKLKSCKVEVNVPSVLTYLWTKAANFVSSRQLLTMISRYSVGKSVYEDFESGSIKKTKCSRKIKWDKMCNKLRSTMTFFTECPLRKKSCCIKPNFRHACSCCKYHALRKNWGQIFTHGWVW